MIKKEYKKKEKSLEMLIEIFENVEIRATHEHKEHIINLRKDLEKPDIDENIKEFLNKVKNVSLGLPDFNEKIYPLVFYSF